MSGIAHLNNHPEFYVESISNNTCANYVQQMSNSGSWCANIIIQAVANANNCGIHITESDINKPEGTTITPVSHDQSPRVIFIGYINELHYVSTMPHKNNLNKSRLASYHSLMTKRKHNLKKEEIVNLQRQMMQGKKD